MGSGGMAMVAALLAVAVMAPGAAAQGNPPACAQRLVSCAQYLGSTKPPESCCGQLREAVKNELPCLCALFNNKQLLEAFKVNVTQALELPKNCGITSDQGLCGTKTTNPNTRGAGGPTAPPATAGGNNDNGAAAVAGLGASGLLCVLAFWWSLVA